MTSSEKVCSKYVDLIFGFEIVLDKNGNIVTDPVNAGTYNFYNPYNGINNNLIEDKNDFINKYFGKHFKYDVAPYYGSGNSDEDTTTGSQRFLRNLYLLNNKNK